MQQLVTGLSASSQRCNYFFWLYGFNAKKKGFLNLLRELTRKHINSQVLKAYQLTLLLHMQQTVSSVLMVSSGDEEQS